MLKKPKAIWPCVKEWNANGMRSPLYILATPFDSYQAVAQTEIPFKRSLKRFLLTNLSEAEDKRCQLFEPERRVLTSPGASRRFVRKRFRSSEKGFGQQPVISWPLKGSKKMILNDLRPACANLLHSPNAWKNRYDWLLTTDNGRYSYFFSCISQLIDYILPSK